MDIPSSWIQELEMQDQELMNQYQINNPNYYYYPTDDFNFDSILSVDCYTETPFSIDQSFRTHKCLEEPFNKKLPSIEKPKTKLVSNTPNSFTISFGDTKPKDEFPSFSDSYGYAAEGKKNVPTTVRNPIQVQDHVLAERKRRQKLAQRFNSLSSLVPNLKKMDKATVLEGATNYIQELENRVKELESKKMQEPVITSMRPRFSSSNDNGSSSNEANFEDNCIPCTPVIEAMTCGCNLLVEIYSEKKCISLVKLLCEMQKFGLSIISSSTMPFAGTTHLVTVVAKKNDDFVMSIVDLVKNLQVVV